MLSHCIRFCADVSRFLIGRLPDTPLTCMSIRFWPFFEYKKCTEKGDTMTGTSYDLSRGKATRRSLVILAACCISGAVAIGALAGQPVAQAQEDPGVPASCGVQVDQSLFDDPEALEA